MRPSPACFGVTVAGVAAAAAAAVAGAVPKAPVLLKFIDCAFGAAAEDGASPRFGLGGDGGGDGGYLGRPPFHYQHVLCSSVFLIAVAAAATASMCRFFLSSGCCGCGSSGPGPSAAATAAGWFRWKRRGIGRWRFNVLPSVATGSSAAAASPATAAFCFMIAAARWWREVLLTIRRGQRACAAAAVQKRLPVDR